MFKNKWKIDVVVLAKGFIEDFADTITNLGDAFGNIAIMGFLCILGIDYILGNLWFSIDILSIRNLLFKFVIFLLKVSTADNLLILLQDSGWTIRDRERYQR